jgi:hypothetical protein
MEKLEQIPEALRVSKSISNTSMRKSFNAEEYMYNLKLKMGSDYLASKSDLGYNSNFAKFIAKEKDYLKSQSNLNLNSNTNLNSNKNEFDSINYQNIRSINNPNVSMNIYDTISANFNKENLGFGGSQNNFFQSSTRNLNANVNSNNIAIEDENSRNDNMKVISENKNVFKSFSKDPKEFDLLNKQDEKINAFSIIADAANSISPKTSMFTSSHLNSGNNINNNNFFTNNINCNSNNKSSNPLGNADQNKKSNNFFYFYNTY